MHGYIRSYVGHVMYKEGNVTKSAVMSCWDAQIYSSCLSLAHPQKPPKDQTIFYIMPHHPYLNFHFSVVLGFFLKKYFVSSSISILFEANFKNPH